VALHLGVKHIGDGHVPGLARFTPGYTGTLLHFCGAATLQSRRAVPYGSPAPLSLRGAGDRPAAAGLAGLFRCVKSSCFRGPSGKGAAGDSDRPHKLGGILDRILRAD
jgi:hypothetical protein